MVSAPFEMRKLFQVVCDQGNETLVSFVKKVELARGRISQRARTARNKAIAAATAAGGNQATIHPPPASSSQTEELPFLLPQMGLLFVIR